MNNLDDLTLEEAIAHAEEVAEDAKLIGMMVGTSHITELEQMRCANEHKQLAEWLKELKSLKENKTGKWKAYKDCEGKTRRITCNLCGWQSHSLCWYDYNYCPNCGAKMEGADDEI